MLLTIEKMIYGGDGLARLPADEHGPGKAAFVPFVLAAEKVEATITEQKSGFARAHADCILEPSSHRVEPECPYFSQCGGCHYQHASYEHQPEIKKDILRETLRRTAKVDLPGDILVHPSSPWNYRNRSRLQVQTSPEFKAGYFKMASHELLAIEECPISSPLINRGISRLWQIGREGKVPPGVREIEFFANADDSKMLIEISASSDTRRAAARSWAEDFLASMSEIAGIVVFRENSRGTFHPPEKLVTIGAGHLTYQTQTAAYRVSAGSFFQTNRHLTDDLVKIVTQGQSGELALDLYAGAGLFSTALSDFHHIVSVESSQTSAGDLSYNLPSNGVVVQAATEHFLTDVQNTGRIGKGIVPSHTFHKPDLAVVDPPRVGLGERVARMLATLGAPRVVYVSCDPVTLARDLVILLAAGYRIEQVHLVDLFPQTYHLESVVHLIC
ncbi:MAG: 23S rRNA (uracil(1939)-C(5))-methyltransferase RlmD [Candidatus Sulfotelmatobacter sp.]